MTIADLSFITWWGSVSAPFSSDHRTDPRPVYRNSFALAALLPEGVDAKTEFPSVVAWHDKLVALPYVKEVLDEKAAL